jgi:hypothetical protein
MKDVNIAEYQHKLEKGGVDCNQVMRLVRTASADERLNRGLVTLNRQRQGFKKLEVTR